MKIYFINNMIAIDLYNHLEGCDTIKKLYKLSILVISILVLFMGCANKSTSSQSSSTDPSKIIIYNYGKHIALKPSDTNFKEIIKLSLERITDPLSQSQNPIDNNIINNIKDSSLAVEFIFDNKQTLQLSDGKSIEYTKLLFKLDDKLSSVTPGGTGTNLVHYGDNSSYKATLFPLNKSKNLIDLVDSISDDTSIKSK